MRVLLVNPWICDFAAYDLWYKPIGLIRIASCLQSLGVETDLVDCLDRFHPLMKSHSARGTIFGDGNYYTEEIEKPSCLADIPRRYKRYGFPLQVFAKSLSLVNRPDVILIGSGLTYWYPGVFLAIELLKEHFPEVPIILGGIYATLCPGHAEASSGADRVFRGNSLEAILSLLSELTGAALCLETKRVPSDPLNLSAYKLYPELRYVTLRTSKGCPFHCTYCGWSQLDSHFEQFEPEKVRKTIFDFIESHSIQNIALYDDALLFNAENHFIEIFASFGDGRLECNFHAPNGLHCRFLTKDVASIMKRARFVRPRLGLERIHNEVKRGGEEKVGIHDFHQAVDALISAGYSSSEILVNLLVGLPNQTVEEVESAITYVEPLGVRIHLEEYSPVPNTLDFQRSNLSLRDDPLTHNNTAFLFRHPSFGSEINRLKDRAHRLNARHQ